MKTKYFIYGMVFFVFSAFYACKDEQGESSVDNYFLNYQIEEIPVKSDIPVGAYLVNPRPWLMDNEDIWTRITEERDDADGKVGPYMRPVLGQYDLDVDTLGAKSLQQIIDWGNEARIDYFILPVTREDRWQVYPHNLNKQDSAFINLFQMKNDTMPAIHLNGMKYALMVDMNGFCSGLSNVNLIEKVDPTHIVQTYTPKLEDGTAGTPIVTLDTIIPRLDQLYAFYKRISDYFSDPNYYHFNGRPVVLIRGAEYVYTENSELVYQKIRETMRQNSGEDVYLIAQQPPWTPPARFHYFHLLGKVDAVTVRNLGNVGGGNWDRTYWLPQMMNENLKYNREYIRDNYGIDFVPPVSTPYYTYLLSANAYNEPIVPHDPDQFQQFCNVAKMNLGNNPMVIIDSFNNWETGSVIEPTEEGYGNGYGDLYLKLVKEQFKK